MKNRFCKSILALVLAFLMMPFGAFCALADGTEASADLVGISVGNLSISDFDPAVTSYNFSVPYTYIPNDFETIAVPEVKAYAEDPNAEISITQPDAVDGGVATITVTNGDVSKIYTVKLSPAALNIANDGGMEEGSWHAYNVNGLGVAKGGLTTDAAKAGQKSFQFYLTGTWNQLKNPESGLPMDAGVTYLLKYDLMAVDSAFSVYASEKYAPTGRVCTNYYADGSSKSGDTIALSVTDWTQVTQTWYSATANTDPVRFGPTGVANQTMRLDEYYYAPLVVSDIVYSGEKRIQIPESDSVSITFSGALRNQIGGTHGLENETVSYKLLGEYQGVSLSGNTLTVDSTATEAIVPLEMSTTLSFSNGIQTTVSKIQEISVVPDRSGEAVELYDIQVGNLSIPNFDSRTTNYTMLVPYSYMPNDFGAPSVPEVKVYPKNSDAKVTIDYPEAVEGGRIVITVEAGDYTKVYNIDLAVAALNLAADGGMEQGTWVSYNKNNIGFTTSLNSDHVKSGSYSLEMTVGGWSNVVLGAPSQTANIPVAVNPNVKYLTTYYASSPASNGSCWVYQSTRGINDIEKTYYLEDGTSRGTTDNFVNKLASSWERSIMVFSSATGNTTTDPNAAARFQPIPASSTTILMDEFYMAPLTATDIRFNGTTYTELPSAGSVALTLDADLINQIGGTHGLENEAVTFELIGEHTGVSLSGTTLTIDSTASEGSVPVRMKSTYANDAQSGVWDVVEIDLVKALDDNSIKFSKATVSAGSVTASVCAKNTRSDALVFYAALYEYTDGQYNLVIAESKSAAAAGDALVKADINLSVPDDGKTYVIKGFLWNNDLTPVILSTQLN